MTQRPLAPRPGAAARRAFVATVLMLAPVSAHAAPPGPAPSSPGGAPTTLPAPDPLADRIRAATVLIASKQPAAALAIVEEVIAAEEKAHAAETRRIYSAHSLPETMEYALLGAAEHKETVVLDGTWSQAVYFKGYLLIDLGRAPEAEAYLKRAIEMAPSNSQFLSEYGEYQKSLRQFDASYDLFKQAEAAADLANDDVKGTLRRRAWRGQAFARSEQGRFDDAEALYRKCLAEDPADRHALSELDWIAKQRAKAHAGT